MKDCELGATGLQVSAISFGCMNLTSDRMQEGRAADRRAYESGINFYDTADVYSRGG